jgi:hypothetical protein
MRYALILLATALVLALGWGLMERAALNDTRRKLEVTKAALLEAYQANQKLKSEIRDVEATAQTFQEFANL